MVFFGHNQIRWITNKELFYFYCCFFGGVHIFFITYFKVKYKSVSFQVVIGPCLNLSFAWGKRILKSIIFETSLMKGTNWSKQYHNYNHGVDLGSLPILDAEILFNLVDADRATLSLSRLLISWCHVYIICLGPKSILNRRLSLSHPIMSLFVKYKCHECWGQSFKGTFSMHCQLCCCVHPILKEENPITVSL